MKCPHCGFDRILPMYKFCPKCRQVLNASSTDESSKEAIPQDELNTKLLTGLFWSYPKAIKDPQAFKAYAKKNPNDSARLLAKWKEAGCDISTLIPSNSSTSSNNSTTSHSHLKPEKEPEANQNSTKPHSESDVNTVSSRNHAHNYVSWTIAQGQIARNISAQEFASIADVDGVYVQEGVTAVIFVDGVLVTELNGGLYKFATEKISSEVATKYAEDEEDKRAHKGIIRKIGRTGRSLLNLVFGKSDQARKEEKKKRRDTIKELARKISGNSIVSAVLKRDGAVSFPMGIRPLIAEDGSVSMEFTPYKIRTQSLTIDVAISLEARISDFYEFRTTYLMDKNSYSVNDLRIALNAFMRTTIQRVLQNYAADGDLLPQDLMASISYELMTASKELLHGIIISNVLNITTENEILERFRSLDEKLLCTEKEIDYYNRTNEFKNRLQTAENQQRLTEARTELELRKELDNINKDQLIHEDEMEAFVQLHQGQKRIREARTENEELAALLKLKGNRLVSEDEYDELESNIRDKKFDRDQVSATFQLTSAHRTEMTRVQLSRELQKNQLLAEAELNDVRFDEVRKDMERNIQLTDMQQEHDLAAAKRQDEYTDSRREKDFDFDQRIKEAEYAHTRREQKDNIDLEAERLQKIEKERAQLEMDILRQKAELAHQNTAAMNAHEKEMAGMSHEEAMARIAAQQNMSAEQLMAAGAAGLSAEAQKAFAESLAAGKGSEKEREMYERMLQMQAQMSSSSQGKQESLMQQMMAMMQGAMQTNATMVSNMFAGQATQTKAQMDAMQNIAGARLAQTENMKEEYRKQMEHEQKRTDAAQDRALNYTTKITQEEIKASVYDGALKEKATAPYYLPIFGASYTLQGIGNLILNGYVNEDTELEINGTSLTVAEVDEFLPYLAWKKKYGNA